MKNHELDTTYLSALFHLANFGHRVRLFFRAKVQNGKKTIAKDVGKETTVVRKIFVMLYIHTFKFHKKDIWMQREWTIKKLFWYALVVKK